MTDEQGEELLREINDSFKRIAMALERVAASNEEILKLQRRIWGTQNVPQPIGASDAAPGGAGS